MSKERSFPDSAVLVGAATLRGLLAAGADLQERDKKGRTALFRVARVGQVEKLRLLIEAGSDVNAMDSMYECPLQCAARYGHVASVEALLAAGADISYIGPASPEGYGESALFSSIGKSVEVPRLLLEKGADPNAANGAKRYPLIRAICFGHPDLVPMLIRHGASVNIALEDGMTPLHLAMQEGNAAFVRDLVAAGADINAVNERGETPIYCGVDSEHDSIGAVVELLKSGPDLTIAGNVFDQTPLERALFVDKAEIAALLRSAGAPSPRNPGDGEDEGDVCEMDEAAGEVQYYEPEWEGRSLREDQERLRPTAQDEEWAAQADREVPSLFQAFGHGCSEPHWRLYRCAEQPLALNRMTYFARGCLNAPKGRERADGIQILGEPYEDAAERFVSLGILRRVETTRAIPLAYGLEELRALAKEHGVKMSGTKQDVFERLFPRTGEAAFIDRVLANGSFFELTPVGRAEAEKFRARQEQFRVQLRKDAVDALVEGDYLRATKCIRALRLSFTLPINTPPATDPARIACARAILSLPVHSSVRFDRGSKARCLSIAANYVLYQRFEGCDWRSWDPSINPPKDFQGTQIPLTDFCGYLPL
ncbi:MAG: ankyrin repeat domain-containing protein [Candidatus Sumerlaeaceae bacterium]|nr:ankyrin repeat domain-containing protein [Candidatus Sumerlaeaceae bacterium]